ncbi:hypothetical protein [Zoogloea sp.]|uniref:hypothetical protein n=1 Tax=Zoogloea sp. TaxID=49181 RepID=UPI0035AE2291
MLTPKMLMAAANRLFQKQKGELSFASRNFGRGAETARNDCRDKPCSAAAMARQRQPGTMAAMMNASQSTCAAPA